MNMKAVLQLTGLTPDTLRAWERRYGAVRPKRARSGRRVYSSTEVARLKLLSTLSQAGHTISRLAVLSDAELSQLLKLGTRTERDPEIGELVASIERFDLSCLQRTLAGVRFRVSPERLVTVLIPELMREVGECLLSGRLSIAQEHALSEVVKRYLKQAYDSLEALENSSKSKLRLAFAAPEGHWHEIALLISAILARSFGLQTAYLGPNLPANDMADAVKKIKATALVLSVSHLNPEDERVPIRKFLSDLDRDLFPSCELWIGGARLENLQKLKLHRTPFWMSSISNYREHLERGAGHLGI